MIELPIKHPELFESLGVAQPKVCYVAEYILYAVPPLLRHPSCCNPGHLKCARHSKTGRTVLDQHAKGGQGGVQGGGAGQEGWGCTCAMRCWHSCASLLECVSCHHAHLGSLLAASFAVRSSPAICFSSDMAVCNMSHSDASSSHALQQTTVLLFRYPPC